MKVSVIIPIYNGERFIEKTVENILSSTHKDLEVILVNDGSTDSSFNICEKLKKKDSRVLTCNQENGGVFAARNTGLSVATGDYICFCDQDDIVDCMMYEKMLSYANEGNVDLIICSTYKVIDNKLIPFDKLPERHIDTEKERNKLVGNMLFRELTIKAYEMDYKMSCTIWKCMIKREIILENNIVFRRFVSYEDDLLFLLDVLSYAKRIQMIPDKLYQWRINTKSESHHGIMKKYIEDLCEKSNELMDEITRILRRCNFSEKNISVYHQMFFCNKCNDVLENEVKRDNKRDRKQIIKKLRGELLVANYRELADGGELFRNLFLKKKYVMRCIKCDKFESAYRFQLFYSNLKKNQFVVKVWNRMNN